MVDLIDEWLGCYKGSGCRRRIHQARDYESQRYWRGPVWIHINWMIALGADDYGYSETGATTAGFRSRLHYATSGFWEYFDADTGDGCGGDNFSWTAAIALFWLSS